MQKIFLIPAFMFLLTGITACSSESVKRAAHDTMENIQYQDCQRSLRDDCKTESYEEYQRKRKESAQHD